MSGSISPKVGYVFEPVFLEHDAPGHPESSERLTSTMDFLRAEGLLPRLTRIPARPLSTEELSAVHSLDYIQLIKRASEQGGGYLHWDTYIVEGSFRAAATAAGGCIAAVEAVVRREVDRAFALVRPPGHHALPERGMGFCLFNNIAFAARYALEHLGLERLLIVDFDLHHGNGTQAAFYTFPQVLYFSVHQYPHYPGTGHWQEIGKGAGRGTTVNVPVPAGVGDKGYERIFQELLLPLARRFAPQLILVSAGYDAHWSDPLGGICLSIAGYARLTQMLKELAEELAEGRLAFMLEGGYQLPVLNQCIANAFRLLLGGEAAADPFGPAPRPSRDIGRLIEAIKALHKLE